MAYADLIVSFLSLAKNNGGKFKSEKQAKFLTSQTDNGFYCLVQDLHFGEYDQRTNRNTAKVEWQVQLDSVGILQIIKHTTTKGSVVYFDRLNPVVKVVKPMTQKQIEKKQADNQRKKASFVDSVNYYKNGLQEAQNKLEQLKNERNDPEFIEFTKRFKSALKFANEEIANQESLINELKGKIQYYTDLIASLK